MNFWIRFSIWSFSGKNGNFMDQASHSIILKKNNFANSNFWVFSAGLNFTDFPKHENQGNWPQLNAIPSNYIWNISFECIILLLAYNSCLVVGQWWCVILKLITQRHKEPTNLFSLSRKELLNKYCYHYTYYSTNKTYNFCKTCDLTIRFIIKRITVIILGYRTTRSEEVQHTTSIILSIFVYFS